MYRSSTHLTECPSIAHGFFGRKGGVSAGIYEALNCGIGSRDDAASVRENRRRVMEALGAEEAVLCTLSQVHSAHVVSVRLGWHDSVRPEADAMVTNQPNILLGILTADCAPLLFADSEAGVIGAAHAGWRGALSGVLENTITAMEALGAQRRRIAAALGPTIAQASYEVGAAFAASFLEQSQDNAQFFDAKQHFNLPAYVMHRLSQLGLASVQDLAIDTYANEAEYFSFRRSTHKSEADYGRQISAIMLTEQNT